MPNRTFKVWRGDQNGGGYETYEVEVDTGMVVLDALFRIQAKQAGDLAIRWNCKAGKCGSCLLYTSPSPRDQRGSRMPSSA